MKVNREQLLNAMESVKPGIGTNIEQSDSFVFMDNKILSYNDEISISYPIEEIDFEGAIRADEFYKLIKKFTAEEIDITSGDAELLIRSGRSKSGISFKSEIKLPLAEIAGVRKWKSLPENFNRLAKFAMQACSEDRMNPILSTVYISKEGYLQGSDSFKIVHGELGTKIPVGGFLMPATSVREVVKVDPNKVAAGNDWWVHFKNAAGVIISCRVFDEKYPEVIEHLNVKGESFEFPKLSVGIIEKAAIFANTELGIGEQIEVRLGGNRLTISGRSNIGWFKENIRVEYDGDSKAFMIAPYLLLDILGQTRQCIIGDRGIKFVGEDWQYVSALTVLPEVEAVVTKRRKRRG